MAKNKNITIGLAGCGSGGHFYPLIAVGEVIRQQAPAAKLIYFGPDPYNQEALDSINAVFSKVSAGKRRGYFSWHNFIDPFKTVWGFFQAFIKLLFHYPDVIFSKGGFGALPVLVAAKILGIPFIIHDSDTIPGRVSLLSEKWADRVALAWPQATKHVTNPNTAIVGIPIRQSLINQSKTGGREFLGIPDEAVVIFVIGGSQGAQKINTVMLEALPELLENFYIIHQAGENHLEEMKIATDALLNPEQKAKYKLFGNLSSAAMARSYGAADIVLTRAGATSLFETAIVGQVPAFVVPINKSINDHQRQNAYAYQTAGAGIVIEEANLKPDLLINDIKTLLRDTTKYQAMKQATLNFADNSAADKIATEIITIAHEHN